MITSTINSKKNQIFVFKHKDKKIIKTTNKWKTDSKKSYSPKETLSSKYQNLNLT